jgi:hypothetical protein
MSASKYPIQITYQADTPATKPTARRLTCKTCGDKGCVGHCRFEKP